MKRFAIGALALSVLGAASYAEMARDENLFARWGEQITSALSAKKNPFDHIGELAPREAQIEARFNRKQAMMVANGDDPLVLVGATMRAMLRVRFESSRNITELS